MVKFLQKLLSVIVLYAMAGLVNQHTLMAQIVGSDGFMKGSYVQVGVNGCGAYASSTTPPAGYVSTGLSGLNFIADSDKDGWDVGTPYYCGDYAIPGSPVEGWGIQIGGVNYYNTDQYCTFSDIPGSILSYDDYGDSVVIVWGGSVAGVDITQTSTIYADKLFFVTDVTLINSSGSDLTDIYYKRNIDPDNEASATGNYNTINTIEANPSGGDPYAWVTAVGLTYGCYLAIVANNMNASCSYGNFGTTSGSAISDAYNGYSGYNLSGTHTADEAIQMSFHIASLPAGGKTTFAFAHVFTEDEVEEALEETFVPSDDATDVGVINITSPESGCGLFAENVTVTVFNFGYEAQSDIPVNYRVDGGPVITDFVAGPVDPGTFEEHTFGVPAVLAVVGDHSIYSWTSKAGDAVIENDSTQKIVTNIPVISSFPYYQDFETGTSGWISGGLSSTWELGSPASFVINTPPPATPSSVNSWKTDLDGYYAYGENSYVQGPCFDMTSLVEPYVELDIWHYTPDNQDGVRLEYSLDAGVTWEAVGGLGTGDNWYTAPTFAFGYDPILGTNRPAWEGSSGGWKTAHHDISFLAGEPQVQFRIHIATTYYTFYDGVAFDNFRVQDPYAHDLELTALTAPLSMPGLGSAETIVANITNVGLNDESGFNVSYQIDGGSIVTQPFAGTILSGESVDFSFTTTADLSALGDYDIKLWTSLASDEWLPNDTLSTVISNLMPLTGDAAYYIYSNIYGGSEPWYTTTNSTAMNTVFGTGGWSVDYFETLDPATIFGLGTCFVFLEGGDAMADELENFLTTNATAIQNWVASGGHLFLNSAPNEGDGMSFLFGGVELNYAWYTGTAVATDPSDMLYSCYYTPTGTTWTGSSFGHATVSGGGITPMIQDLFGTDKYTLASKDWGAGKILFGGMTPNYFHAPPLEAANLRASIIKSLAVCALADIDLGVLCNSEPVSGCGLGLEPVTVAISNYGLEDQVNIPVNFQIDGGAVVSEIYAGPIEAGETMEYTFITPGDFSVPGDHTIDAWTSMLGDVIISNDSSTKTITSFEVITSYPYNQDFESGAGSWSAGGTYSSWELGSPAGPVISGAPPATPGSLNSWGTDLVGDYNYNENSYLQGPCFDFTTLLYPYIDFDIWWATPLYNDGIRLEYSIDEGTTWEGVGAIGEGDNWYNNTVYALGYDPIIFSYRHGWTGSSYEWKHAQHDLSFLAGQPSVKLRFHFASQYYTGYDGVAVDNINIQDPYNNDIGVLSIDAPAEYAAGLSADEDITVSVKNFGINPQSVFNVAYQADGGAIVSEPYTGPTLNAGDIASFTFAAGADLSAVGMHDICAWTLLGTDEDLTNDTTCADIDHLAPVSGTDAYLLYSSTTFAEPFYGTEYNDAMTEVFGASGYTLDYYESLDPLSVFSENTCFIYMQGSGDHGNELNAFLNTNRSLVEAWVASGGNLLLSACPYEGSSIDFGFGDVMMNIYYYSYAASAVDASHPIFIGPYTPVATDYSGDFVSYGYLSGDFTPILEEPFSGYDLIGEKTWGDGQVMFASIYTPQYWSYFPTEGMNLHRNMIDYLKLCAPVDVGVSDLISPESGCGIGSSEAITIEITNYGATSVTNIPVVYQVDATTPVTEVYAGPLDAGATASYTFTTLTSALASATTHTVTVYSDLSGDGNAANDSYSASVTTLESPTLDLGSNQTVCDEYVIDAGNPGDTYLWSTGAVTQTIVVTETGTYSVTVTDPGTGCTATDAITVTVTYSPTGSFTYTAVGLSVTFTNTSTGGASYLWDFGDGATSTLPNPTHVYSSAGEYDVKLTVTNSCGDDNYTTTVAVIDAIEEIDLANATDIYPNPTSGLTVVDVNFTDSYDVKFELVNVLGETLWTLRPGVIQSGAYEIDMRSYADGVYQLKVTADNMSYTKQIILTK